MPGFTNHVTCLLCPANYFQFSLCSETSCQGQLQGTEGFKCLKNVLKGRFWWTWRPQSDFFCLPAH